MLPEIPARAWLLLTLAAAAYLPATYLFRYVQHSPRRRDITLPPEDLSWRTSALLARNLAILAGLAALAVFIFTPAAERFARSPSFLPVILLVMGVLALSTVPRGLSSGRIEPVVRGFSKTYERAAQPKRFWASVAWNALLGAFSLFVAVMTFRSQDVDRCHDDAGRVPPTEQIAACEAALARAGNSREDAAALHFERGLVLHELGKEDKALADFDKAVELNPGASYALYNRALIYRDGEQFQFAIEDFSRSLALRPDNKDGYLNRGELYSQRGEFRKAITDLTRAYDMDPKDPGPLASRALAYAFDGAAAEARRDAQTVAARQPSSPTPERVEAILSLRQGDTAGAIRHLNAAVRLDPTDRWSLSVMVGANREIGDVSGYRAAKRRLDAAESRAER